ncbi:MAG: sigma 54-interacting transcriptional regulator [Myxococcales bacterium]|nr:sigma 54-interacting transcriptional regulator [Myxococcales bacterium]
MTTRLGPVELEALVGQGSSATVFRGRTARGALLAVKRVDHEAAWREAELLARLDLAYGPRVVASGEAAAEVLGGAPGGPPARWVALTWAEGRPLGDAVRDWTFSAQELALVVAHGVGRALAELHALGFCHGDVKPDNVVVSGLATRDSPDGRGASLVDYGFAARATEESRGATRHFAAPELLAAMGAGRPALALPEADSYALGVILSELVEGVLPGACPRADACRAWAEALMARLPTARPSPAWVADRASALLGLPREEPRDEDLLRRVARAAIAVSPERARGLGLGMVLDEGIEEPTRTYLSQASERLAAIGVTAEVPPVRALVPLELRRWLVRLVGPHAAQFSLPEGAHEGGLARLLVARARELGDLRALTARDLTFDAPARVHPIEEAPLEGQALLRVLFEPRSREALRGAMRGVEAALARGAALPLVSVVAYAERLVRDGAVGEAFATLRTGPTGEAIEAAKASGEASSRDVAEACVVAAEVARRRGDPDEATGLAKVVEGSHPGGATELRSRARAVRARIAWDRGELDEAAALVEGLRPLDPYVAEVRGLVAYTWVCQGDAGRVLPALSALEAAIAECTDGGLVGRLENVSGMIAHAAGEPERARAAFQRARVHATREGAIVDEASYATGMAAAATDVGDVPTALAEATRAALLWERLGQPGRAARAFLSMSAAYGLVGAVREGEAAAREAVALAASASDSRAEAYALLGLAEVARDASQAADAARRADTLLAGLSPVAEPDLSATARLLVFARETVSPSRMAACDAKALREPSAAAWDYWGARARARPEVVGDGARSAREVLAALVELATLRPNVAVSASGPALAAGRTLARELGDETSARTLDVALREVVGRVKKWCEVRPELVANVPDGHWLTAPAGAIEGTPAAPSELLPAQIAQLEGIVRTLASRERLRPLLEQVLDALVLWTGVERGLLLLRAPNGKLLPRAARNLEKKDLEGDKLRVSTTLARRAFETGEAIVALDAFQTHGDAYASVHALGLRSVLAVPLVARGEVLGVVYLDDRVKRGAFGPRELSWVRLLSTQAAMAISDARDKVLLRRALRREQRAAERARESLGRVSAELTHVRARLGEETHSFSGIVGRAPRLLEVLRVADRVAASDVPVLVLGESGTGKELVARAIHERGPRRDKLFVSENCASVPEPLLESTLFGHVRGAFTGASATRVGLFELAHKGTLFLDEIGEMSPAMQVKLLRVLQDGEVRPLGGERGRKVDVRVLGATHRDLAAMVRAGAFREDLYYRLNVVTLTVPSLRERASDIPELVAYFLAKYGGTRPVTVTRAAMAKLVAYGWPGNVRQLENEIRRALVLADERIDTSELSTEISLGAGQGPEGRTLRDKVDALEAELVREALRVSAGNQSRAAQDLGLSRFGLQKMMKRLGIKVG